jgi:hypothetical protein
MFAATREKGDRLLCPEAAITRRESIPGPGTAWTERSVPVFAPFIVPRFACALNY